jgi:hypothetical protein
MTNILEDTGQRSALRLLSRDVMKSREANSSALDDLDTADVIEGGPESPL